MNKIYQVFPMIRFALGIGLLVALYFCFAFKNTESPASTIKKTHLDRVLQFDKSINQLEISFQKNKKIEDRYNNVRETYKSIETYLAYFDPQWVYDEFNGPPLPRTERKASSLVELEPHGLQVLDEILAEKVIDEKAFHEEIKRLKNIGLQVQKHQKNIIFYDRHIFEANRQALLRIITFSATGFDTPGSLNGLKDALTIVNCMNDDLLLYKGWLKNKSYDHTSEFYSLLAKTKDYLKQNQDFDSFDHFTFTKHFVNPLYEEFLTIQEFLGIETIKEVSSTIKSVNYYATSIYDSTFLNPNYFLGLQKGTKEKQQIALGKVLFFDPILSENNERSCASCHLPELAFSDGVAKSLAFGRDKNIKRNAPVLINSVFAEKYFHDLRTDQFIDQIEHVVHSEDEFNTDFRAIKSKLSASDEYKALFKNAYGKEEINKEKVSKSIAHYVASLNSFNSEFDQTIRGDLSSENSEVIAGYNLFMGKAACGTCHFPPTFSGLVPPLYKESESEVLGVPANNDFDNPIMDDDLGRINNKLPKDGASFYKNAFKTPTLRNIALTAPYMHNGVFNTLQEVIEFYDLGGGAGLGLQVPNQTLSSTPLGLSEREKQQLETFLIALNDTTVDLTIPKNLPKIESANNRVIGGLY